MEKLIACDTGEMLRMVETVSTSVMRRIVRPARTVVAEPVTPARALRQALTRAAERAVGLALVVLGIRQVVAPLDDVLAQIEDDLLLSVLMDAAGPCGFLGIDLQTRAAVIEAQTLGRVSPKMAPSRKATTADLAMAEPFVMQFLSEIELETRGTVLDGWVAGHRPQGRFADPREAGLTLGNGDYRIVRMTLDLGAGDRQGLMVLALPMPPTATAAAITPAAPDWSDALAGNVMAAQTEVRAVLHRMRLPLRLVEGFELGQVLALPGVSVGSVRIEAADARLIGQARLGQMSGMRAVRIGPPGRPEMEEAPRLPSAQT